MYQQMASIQRLSNSLVRISGSNFGKKYTLLVPTRSIMYINILEKCLDIHYKHRKSFDNLHFQTNAERDSAVAVVEECFDAPPHRKHPLVKDYPF